MTEPKPPDMPVQNLSGEELGKRREEKPLAAAPIEKAAEPIDSAGIAQVVRRLNPYAKVLQQNAGFAGQGPGRWLDYPSGFGYALARRG